MRLDDAKRLEELLLEDIKILKVVNDYKLEVHDKDDDYELYLSTDKHYISGVLLTDIAFFANGFHCSWFVDNYSDITTEIVRVVVY